MGIITRDLLEKDYQAGKYNKSILQYWRGGKRNVEAYYDLPTQIPKDANGSGKIVIPEGASTSGTNIMFKIQTWTVLTGTIKFKGNIYRPGSTVMIRKDESYNIQNIYAGDTIIGFVLYLGF